MKKNDRLKNLTRWGFFLVLFVFANNKGFAQTPITCNNAKTYVVTQNVTGINAISSLYTIDMITGATNLIKTPILPASEGSNRRINAIGYNAADGFIYGYRSQTNQIVRIDALGNYQLFTVPGLVTADVSTVTAGDIHNNALYLFDNQQARLWKIDLSTLTVTIIPFTLPVANDIFTIAFNDFSFGLDGNIYGILTDKRLFKINLTTGALTYLGNATGTGISAETGSWGTTFTDSAGNLYVGNNASRNTYKFEYNPITNTYSTTGTLFVNAQATGQVLADGASCAFTIPPQTKDDTGCISNSATTQTITTNVLNNDIEGTFDLNPSSVRLIDPITSLPSTSVTITGQGTFMVNTTTGEITFNSLVGFTGTSIKYVVSDINGNTSTQATLSITNCACQQPPTDITTSVPVKHGITLLGRAGADNGNWPMLRNSAYTTLESKTKGFVITRIANPETAITDPKVGMMVFDTDENAGKGCLKIFVGPLSTDWKCFGTPNCP